MPKKIYLFLTILIASIFFISPKSVEAAENNDELGYCFYCNANSDVYEKETQFIRKIKIIKQVFGDKIDEIVLAATVLHQYTLTDVVDDQYDENFDASQFQSSWSEFNNNYTKLDNVGGNTNAENEQIDLITAATIVMLDSNGFQTYNEEKYKEALAKSQLVGDGSGFGQAFNAAFCTAGAAIDFLGTPLEYIHGVFTGNSVVDITNRKQTRWFNMLNICQNGYIGGTYTEIKKLKEAQEQMSDDKQKQKQEELIQLKKEMIAQGIIDLANEYKRLYGKSNNSCLTGGSTQATIFKDTTPEEYISIMGPIAQADYSRTGVFASVTLAQSIIESGWGKSGLTQQANNFFGIKCGGWTECIVMSTGEYGSGGYYTINAGFRKYDSIESSVNDHSALFSKSPYTGHNVLGQTNYSNQIKAIHDSGYATDPNYASTIINTIKTYKLDQWDVMTNTTSSSGICAPVGTADWALRTIKPNSSDSAFNYVNSNRGQCVWYAQGRAIEIIEELGAKGKLSADQVTSLRNELLKALGNGGEIYDNAVSRNSFNTSNNIREPKPGSFIVWKEPGHYGHVAIVEDVNKVDNTITITEGWADGGSSCPNSWDCVNFLSSTFDLEEFYSGYGQSYTGGYQFSGYVYFLEQK